ncbi:lysophospholipid acyltransferase family protein [Labrys monachus]|uniref:KDO2-lipid IV(A) lauroyltransferase n=1 Tax=Labrys monachus TaxID=217067 RepID=A0ABU0FEJ0_9HYPH|nr:lauroyl acyltransferase [Labrys monachus]MDQ0392946.1 KDO2-lipid IV(A) lauroyltransferase [Labrys monachus]
MAGGADETSSGRRWRWLKYTAEYGALRALIGLLHLMPLDFASWLMGVVWRSVAPRLKRHERALRHLAMAYPEKSPAEIEAIAREMWMQLGRTFAENLMLKRLYRAGRIDDRTGPVLDSLKGAGKGIVFVSLHIGNWELVITPAAARGIKAAGIYQRIKNPKVDDYVSRARRDRYPRGLYPKGADVARKLMRVAREGGAVAILADLRDRRGISVPFFGHPAPSTSFPALLCRSSEAILVAARTVRTGGVHFMIEAQEIKVPRTADRDADIAEATRRIHALFEQWVREHPEQWMWAHRRWG